MNFFLGILSLIYGFFSMTRNWLYDRKWIRATKLSVPVISVGNLTVGGTGKTPFTDFLISRCLSKSMRVGIGSRAYKAQAKKPVRVDASLPNAAYFFGDEPTLLAQKHSEARVYVGRKKYEIALDLIRKEKVDVIVVDDGFQHRKLARTLDFVLLDATDSEANYRWFPLGRGRESLKNLKRADALVVTKSNLAEGTMIKKFRQEYPEKKLFNFDSVIESIVSVHDGSPILLDNLPKRVFMFCGLARPESFRSLLLLYRKDLQVDIKFFPDHHRYTADDVQLLIGLKTLRQSLFITTEKDAVKIKNIWPKDVPLAILRMGFEMKNSQQEFDEYIFQKLS